MTGPQRLESILSGVLEKHGIKDQVERISGLDAWPEIVGEKLASVTSVRGVRDAILFVEVRSSAWLMELNMMKGEFLEQVNTHLVDLPVQRIVFVLAETE